MARERTDRLTPVAEILYALLRVALSSGPGEEPHLGVLTPEEWRALLTLAREQTVTGLVYDALRRPQYACFVPEEISLPLMLEAEKIERRSKKVRGVSDELLSGLSAAGLYPIIFKGPSIAALYPVPELRISGDIDLYVPPTEADAAVEWLCGHGAMVSSSPDGALLSRMGGIDIDLHTRYFDLAAGKGPLPPVPSPEATVLMLSAHILKHAMGPGVGLRQICDFAVACRAYPHIDGERLFAPSWTVLWGRMLAELVHTRLGMDTGLFPSGRPVSFASLERIIFSGGNFGHFAAGRQEMLLGTDQGRTGGDSTFGRKADTLRRILQRAPFGLRVAPGEYIHRLFSLVRGNLQ